MGYEGRDVEVVFLNEAQCLVAACDSCGGVGMKEFDDVKVSWRITGRLTARVALLEVLSVGAIPRMITVAISNEPKPAGEEILKGVNDELNAIGLPLLPMAISTEKNIPTKQTGLGISAVGLCEKDKLRIRRSNSGNSIYCLGLPKVGSELKGSEDPEIIQGSHVLKLLESSKVYDIIPVGSKGIRGEAETLAKIIGAELILDSHCELNMDKSAGPSTCVIFTASEGMPFNDFGAIPIHKVGMLG